jgi:DNA-binding NarL/FixJ family response regulator
MGHVSRNIVQRLEAEIIAPAAFDGARRPRPARAVPPADPVAARARSESRIAVLTADPLLAFAVTTIAVAHFPEATVLRPEVDDLLAARHFDSRTHALIVVDGALLGELGQEAFASWLRPFRYVPILLLSAVPGSQRLEHCAEVMPVARDVTPRGLAEAIRTGFSQAAGVPVERRPRPQEIERITATQWRVIGYLGAGHSNKEIAYRMGISEATVKAHVGAAIARLGLTNRTEVALFSQRLSLGARWARLAAEINAPA